MIQGPKGCDHKTTASIRRLEYVGVDFGRRFCIVVPERLVDEARKFVGSDIDVYPIRKIPTE